MERLQQSPRLSLGGLHGSAATVLVHELAQRMPVVLIANKETQKRYWRELRRIGSDVMLTSEENPRYAASRITLVEENMLHREVTHLETLTLQIQQEIDLEQFLKRLEKTAYTREENVEEENEYANRGGILDIFPADSFPARIELFGDRIFSIRRFDTQTQRSVENIERLKIKLARTDQESHTLAESIPPNAVVVTYGEEQTGHKTLYIRDHGDIQYQFTAPRIYFGDFRTLIEEINKREYRYKFLVSNSLARKLRSLLGEAEIHYLPLEAGFTDMQRHITYLTENEIFGKIRRRPVAYKGPFVDDLMGFKEGDYVVHSDYGIGKYVGSSLVNVEGKKIECLQIAYAGKDKLFLPIERLNLLERFVATDDRPPRLSRLGGEVWLRTKRRIKRATERLALELLKLYARRMQQPGFTYSPDSPELKALEATFPYEETKDQLAAINDVKRDMESPKPCERLICGDVGYGKTEIALRVAFKAALDGKQTMLLCPTTLLAFQHFNTFKSRLAPFPVNVEMVSRFRRKPELEGVLAKTAVGDIDIIIGTHRLLQPDVRFKDLGLLVIDEEQRFGVAQKEKIKKMSPGVDVIYLSATPIPRTLYMALTGIKNISNIHTPPPGRKDIITKIINFDETTIEEAVTHETDRGGQVFFVHNRIQTIDTVRAKLSEIFPDLRICLLHGQMREDITAKRMVEFIDGAYDVLLSTAIVESGLDMPRVNTIIVDQAHKFGLADLHQLRGRVGRGEHQGYAYFIVPARGRMSDEAHKRMGALASYATLGSGFRLALRDMEIRGVGNLLGKEQSGHINSIGYHHYIRLLSESVGELQGRIISHEPVLDLKLDAYFPSEYVSTSYERTALYKRLLEAESLHELSTIKEEIVDRFGRYPATVENLFTLSSIRLKAREIGASEVIRKGSSYVFYREGKPVHKMD